MNKELDSQNQHIARITGKVRLQGFALFFRLLMIFKADRVDDQIVMNRARLDRIK